MTFTCSKQFSITTSAGGTFYNELSHTAYGWCNADPESVLEATIAIGGASSVVSQEDAELEACAMGKAILEQTLLPMLCPGGPWTIQVACDVPPVITYYSEEILASFFPACLNATNTCTDGTNDGQTFAVTGIAAGAYTSIISQADADNQATAAFAAANAGQQAFEDACSLGGGYTNLTC